MQIVPMRDLKDTVKIENLCASENGPVFVTKNGYGRLVVMDIEYYEKTMQKIYEANAVNACLNDMEKSKTIDGDSVIGDMSKKYGINL